MTWLLVVALLAIAPASAAAPLTTAQVLKNGIDFGDWNKTLDLCNQILRKDPNNVDALLARASLNSLNGKTNEAMADCDKAIAEHPSFALAYSTRGAILCSNTKKWKADFKSYLALTQSAHDTSTRLLRAGAFKSLKDPKSAKKELQIIVTQTVSATKPEELFNRVIAHMELGKYKEALVVLSKLQRIYPKSPRLLSCISLCHLENGDTAIALKEFAAIEKMVPNYFSLQGAWGQELEKQKKYKEAINHYDKALQIEGNYLFGLRHRAWCYLKTNEYELASKDLNKVIGIEPDDVYAITNRAFIFARRKQYKKAIADYKRATALDPKHTYAWRQLGDTQARLDLWKEALDSSNKALKLSPRDSEALSLRGWIESERGNHRKAHADFAEAIRINPQLESAYFSRAVLYRKQKQYAKSIADLTKAIKINPNDALNFCARGCAEVRNRNYEEAIADCTKSIQLDADRDHPFLSRGEAYSALGKYDLALRDLSKVINDDVFLVEALTERAKVYQKLNKTSLAFLDLTRLKQLTSTEHKVSQKSGH